MHTSLIINIFHVYKINFQNEFILVFAIEYWEMLLRYAITYYDLDTCQSVEVRKSQASHCESKILFLKADLYLHRLITIDIIVDD